MEKQNAPNHVMKYCYRDDSDIFFLYLYKHYERPCSFVYKLKCTCGCNKFIVYEDAHPSVFVKCSKCGKRITVYDLAYYPSAIKMKKQFALSKVEDNPVFVYVNYEYDDEFMYEEDVEFNADDITWGRVFIVNSNKLEKILDDETA